MRFLIIRGTLLGVHVIRNIVFGGLYWGLPILGNYHIMLGAYHVVDVGQPAPPQFPVHTDNYDILAVGHGIYVPILFSPTLGMVLNVF